MLHSFIQNILGYFSTLSYGDIFFLMTLESSIVPVPSELVMIPAGWIAKTGWLNPFIATLMGGLGSLIWATLNYFIIGQFIGKPFLQKYGKYILISPEKYNRAEELFLRNQNLYTFIGRFIPVIRHLISIPAGIFRMPLSHFWSITFLGATLWCSILVSLGWYFWKPVLDIVIQYLHEFKIFWVPLIILYFVWKIWGKSKKK